MTPTIDSITLGSDREKSGSGAVRGTIIFECPDYITVLTGATEYNIARRNILEIHRNLTCGWFLGCETLAVALEPHPILGDVPICQGHFDWLRKAASEK